jgi:site-specific DNA-methyltransferase (adenine-specific)
MVELTNDMVVRLIGIRSRAGKEPDAMKWLWERLKGQSVSLKFDQAKFDEENRLLSYVYLKNKTFVNLHLLRSNLVQLDESFPFRYRERFRAVMAEESPL